MPYTQTMIIGVYFDDLIMTGTSTAVIGEFKEKMNKRFEMSDLGKLAYYLVSRFSKTGDASNLSKRGLRQEDPGKGRDEQLQSDKIPNGS